MSISSVEELDAMGEGSTIRVTESGVNRTWTKGSEGWTRSDQTGTWVGAKFFAPLLAAGSVTDWRTADPAPGDVYGEGRFRYLITRVADDTVWFLGWRFIASSNTWTFRDRYVRSLDEVRGWTSVVKLQSSDPSVAYLAQLWNSGIAEAYERNLASTIEGREAVARDLTESQRRVRTMERNLRQAQVDHERLEQVRQSDLPTQVRVHVHGTSRMPTEKAVGHVPTGVTVTSVQVHWTRDLVYDAQGPGCVCSQVTREWVHEQLGVDDSRDDDFGWTSDCGRH